MAEREHSRVKPKRLFYSIFTAVIIISFIAPLSTIKVYALDIPIPIYPVNYAITTPDTDPPLGVPSFSWSTVMGANIYRLQAYFWRVAMIDGNNRMGSYSHSATFTKQYPISTLISPISSAVQHTPTFIWTSVDGAATYIFEAYTFSTFFPIYDSTETVNTQYTPTTIYQSGKVYYWRVAIRDRNGRQGPFTDATIIIGDFYPSFLPLVTR